MKCTVHDLEVTGSNLGQVKLEVHSTVLLSLLYLNQTYEEICTAVVHLMIPLSGYGLMYYTWTLMHGITDCTTEHDDGATCHTLEAKSLHNILHHQYVGEMHGGRH